MKKMCLAQEELTYITQGGRTFVCDDAGNVLQEYVGDTWVGVPKGTALITPRQQAAKQKWKEQEPLRQLKENLRSMDKNEQFIFAQGERLGGVRPETAARLVMLGTYLPYFGDELKLTQRKAVTRKDLPSVLGITRRTADNMADDAAGILTVDSSGAVCLDNRVLRRGNLPKKHALYHKVRINALRHIWESINQCQHRYLGYIFQTLPYLNVQHNYLCWSPWETDADRISFMSLKEFASVIGYDESNAARLRKAYSGIQFSIGGELATLCAFEDVGRKTRMIVNPDVVYAGKTPDAVRARRAACQTACRQE